MPILLNKILFSLWLTIFPAMSCNDDKKYDFVSPTIYLVSQECEGSAEIPMGVKVVVSTYKDYSVILSNSL